MPLLLQGKLGRKPISFFRFDFKPIDFKDNDGTYQDGQHVNSTLLHTSAYLFGEGSGMNWRTTLLDRTIATLSCCLWFVIRC